MTLREHFKDYVSSSAFKVIDGEFRIVGKFGEITLMDNGEFDIWVIDPWRLGLSHQKLAAIQKSFPVGADLRMLDGEAYTQTGDKELILLALPLLGVKKKRKISPLTRQAMIERLRKAA